VYSPELTRSRWVTVSRDCGWAWQLPSHHRTDHAASQRRSRCRRRATDTRALGAGGDAFCTQHERLAQAEIAGAAHADGLAIIARLRDRSDRSRATPGRRDRAAVSTDPLDAQWIGARQRSVNLSCRMAVAGMPSRRVDSEVEPRRLEPLWTSQRGVVGWPFSNSRRSSVGCDRVRGLFTRCLPSRHSWGAL
jgi:hypothetical protein